MWRKARITDKLMINWSLFTSSFDFHDETEAV